MHHTVAGYGDSIQRTLIVVRRITVLLVSSLTRLDSAALIQANNNIYSFLVEANPVQLEASCTSIRSLHWVLSASAYDNIGISSYCQNKFCSNAPNWNTHLSQFKFILTRTHYTKLWNNLMNWTGFRWEPSTLLILG